MSNSNNIVISNKISQDPLNKIDDNENKSLKNDNNYNNNPNININNIQNNNNNLNNISDEKKESGDPKDFQNLNSKEGGEAKNSKEGEINPTPQNPSNMFNNQPIVYDNKIQKQFKNIFGGNDYFENNYYRKRVMYLTIFCILIDILKLQVLW